MAERASSREERATRASPSAAEERKWRRSESIGESEAKTSLLSAFGLISGELEEEVEAALTMRRARRRTL